MSWYEKLLEVGRDVAPTVAGGAAIVATSERIQIGFVMPIISSVPRRA